MTQTKQIIILDNNSQRVLVTTCEHNPSDDMEVSVSDRLDELNLNLDECSWMEIEEDSDGRIIIESDQLIQVQTLNY